MKLYELWLENLFNYLGVVVNVLLLFYFFYILILEEFNFLEENVIIIRK